jgi:hypothetical protein
MPCSLGTRLILHQAYLPVLKFTRAQNGKPRIAMPVRDAFVRNLTVAAVHSAGPEPWPHRRSNGWTAARRQRIGTTRFDRPAILIVRARDAPRACTTV